MPMYQCPRCRTKSIPLIDKYKTSMWGEIYCSNCKAKLCAYPWLLAGFFILYAWDVAWFSGIFYYTRESVNFVYMILIWLVIDAINVTYMPLAVMRSNPKP